MKGLMAEPILGLELVNRNEETSASAFQSTLVNSLVGEKVRTGCHQERAEFAFLRLDR